MRRLIVAVFVLVLPLAHAGTRAAQNDAVAPVASPAGNIKAGKVYWEETAWCRNCHGTVGEGAFAPTLSGRKLPYERFRRYVRNPIGRMPSYIDSDMTDQDIADVVAYLDSLPVAPTPAAWRTPLPEGAPRGQQLAVAVIACAQCHFATLAGPRRAAARVSGDFEWLKRMVYEHYEAQREQWATVEGVPIPPPGVVISGHNPIRMGSYTRASLPESTLKEIWNWMNDIGPYVVPLGGAITAGAPGPNGVTYTVRVTNSGVKGKGVTAEDVTVALALPAGTTVVSTTGAYEGVRHDDTAKSDVAVWRVPRMPATDQQTLTITLFPAPTTLRGTIRYAKPVVTSDGEINFAMAPPGGRGGRGGA